MHRANKGAWYREVCRNNEGTGVSNGKKTVGAVITEKSGYAGTCCICRIRSGLRYFTDNILPIPVFYTSQHCSCDVESIHSTEACFTFIYTRQWLYTILNRAVPVCRSCFFTIGMRCRKCGTPFCTHCLQLLICSKPEQFNV